ncbi:MULTISPECIES: hypothetical protein [Sphingomonas]|uniref:hypothetical protein n=1 Tax=Sphingomonas TaxID=13687 RepID=UPI000DEF3768|nr:MULTISPECIES: hypothetical protein [Sphingomonas]
MRELLDTGAQRKRLTNVVVENTGANSRIVRFTAHERLSDTSDRFAFEMQNQQTSYTPQCPSGRTTVFMGAALNGKRLPWGGQVVPAAAMIAFVFSEEMDAASRR